MPLTRILPSGVDLVDTVAEDEVLTADAAACAPLAELWLLPWAYATVVADRRSADPVAAMNPLVCLFTRIASESVLRLRSWARAAHLPVHPEADEPATASVVHPRLW